MFSQSRQSCIWLNFIAALPKELMSLLFIYISYYLLLLDNVFKSEAKTKNNVGLKSKPCTKQKPRLHYWSPETAPLKRHTCWRSNRNDPIQLYIYIYILPGSCKTAMVLIITETVAAMYLLVSLILLTSFWLYVNNLFETLSYAFAR